MELIGKKMAEKPFLPYDGIPSGALLYLHDSTRGEEELIFHMEDGKQVFVSDCKGLIGLSFRLE